MPAQLQIRCGSLLTIYCIWALCDLSPSFGGHHMYSTIARLGSDSSIKRYWRVESNLIDVRKDPSASGKNLPAFNTYGKVSRNRSFYTEGGSSMSH